MSYLALYDVDLADITDIADREDLSNVRESARSLRYSEEYDIDEVVRVILLLCSVIENLYDELEEAL